MESKIFNLLSEKQRKVVFKRDGKFVVRACPGSGKTFSVAARMAQKISNWGNKYKGIAVISFTNAAWQEIETQLSVHFGMNDIIHYPHFLGTIDSFLNRFIFLPFGHLVMRCSKRPVLVGAPHGYWTGHNFSQQQFTNLTFDISGNIYQINPKEIKKERWQSKKDEFVQVKNSLIKSGYATQPDANYITMRILEKYPQVSKAIVSRFPMIIIDEAQDTSDIQMKIIDLLLANGLEHLMLVGDPDQAIFEWNEAKPQLFLDKFQKWEDSSVVLNENRRSSQKICNFSFKLSSLNSSSNSVAVNVRNFDFLPQIVPYNNHNLQDVIKSFLKICEKNKIKINKKNVAIVYRSKTIFNEIIGIKGTQRNNSPWDMDKSPCTRELAWGKYLYDRGEMKKGFDTIAKAVIKGMYKQKKINYCSKKFIEDFIEKKGFVYYKKRIFSIIKMMPETNSNIGEWVDETRDNFQKNKICFDLHIKKSRREMTFEEIFSSHENINIPSLNYRLGTIHSVKGETFEAVLVILKTRGKGKAYKTIIERNIQIKDNEEMRIVYVGITRPRKILVLAVPEKDKEIWEDKFYK